MLAFELENRAFFAASIPDRGDDYFAHFDDRLAALLAEQDAGTCHFHVLVVEDDDDEKIVGRFNLVDVADGSAELGYRLAEKATGRGLATAAVREVCAFAADRYGLDRMWATTTADNVRSQAVLERAGFVRTAEIEANGRLEFRYEWTLATAPDSTA